MTHIALMLGLVSALASPPQEQPEEPAPLQGCAWSDEWASQRDELEAEDPSLPIKVKDAIPEWPAELFTLRRGVSPIVEAVIDDSGVVVDAKVLRSTGLANADEAALIAIRKWEFTPATVEDQPVPACMTVVVEVDLR